MDDTERVGAMVSNKEQHRTHLLDYIHIYIKNNIDKSNTIFSLSCVHNRVRSSDESVTSDYLINNKCTHNSNNRTESTPIEERGIHNQDTKQQIKSMPKCQGDGRNCFMLVCARMRRFQGYLWQRISRANRLIVA